jgi:hypothetical protein
VITTRHWGVRDLWEDAGLASASDRAALLLRAERSRYAARLGASERLGRGALTALAVTG